MSRSTALLALTLLGLAACLGAALASQPRGGGGGGAGGGAAQLPTPQGREIDKGAVYRFTLNHVVVPDTPTEMFRTEFLEV
jgi:hypothetical protein